MYKKGESGNPNGRPKGSPNKTPEELRQLIQDFIEKNFDSIQADYESLEPEKRLSFIEKLLKHVLPRPLGDLSQLSGLQLDQVIKGITFDDQPMK